TAVGNGITSSFGVTDVDALKTSSGKLFVGGSFDIAGTDSMSYNIAQWNGNSWSHVGEGFDYRVLCLENFQGSLYAGGEFWATTGYHVMNSISRWDGTNWNSVAGGADNTVTSMYSYGPDLFVGGQFANAGGNPCSYIASWNGTTFSSMAAGVNTNVASINGDDGIIYAGGAFTSADSVPASHIAKWSNAGVGINEISSNENIFIFPNPSNGIFSVAKNNSLENSILEIYNVLGEKINSVELINDITEINLSGEAKGIYFYKVISEGKRISSGKIIRE
ncbi:MAG TPA: T9SS type A sorting domain-containing protein, partial [Bacteroidia bacterium]|nr:T9SS type A sorting domain-containing protein [Bacteroidia bacterium]